MNFIYYTKKTIGLLICMFIFSSMFSACAKTVRQKKVTNLPSSQTEKKDGEETPWNADKNLPNYLALAEDLIEKGYYEVAHVQLNLALEQDKKNVQIYNLKGVCQRETDDMKGAIKSFNSALGIDKNSAQVYNNMGILYFQIEKTDLAEHYFQKAVTLDPARADFLNNYGVLFLSKKEYEKALVQFEKALKLAPNHEKAGNNLAITLGHLKQYDRAMKHLLSEGSFETACYNMGCIYKMNGEAEKGAYMFTLSKKGQKPFDRQILDPEAPRDRTPPAGISGDTGNAIYKRYQNKIESGGE